MKSNLMLWIRGKFICIPITASLLSELTNIAWREFLQIEEISNAADIVFKNNDKQRSVEVYSLRYAKKNNNWPKIHRICVTRMNSHKQNVFQ